MNVRAAPRAARRELLVVASVLLLVGCAVYGPHVLDGGFTIDDWGHAATAEYFRDGIFAHYWGFTSNRPVLVLYVPLTHIVFGPHEWIHNAWSLVLAVGMAVVLYALLRRLRMRIPQAGAIALLVLLFPWSDASRFWATASHINLGIAFGFGGAVLALRGLDERAVGRIHRERALHGGTMVLYALSVLTYEIAGVVLLFAGALYLTRAPRRVALTRWAIDTAVVAACLAWSGIRADRVRPPVEQMISHARELADGGVTIFAQAATPFGSVNRWLVVGILAAVAISALIVQSIRPNGETTPVLRRWLIVIGGGLVVAGAGWVLYIPADPYYQVNAPGVGNRTNVMAAVGLVTVIYATVVLAVTLLLGKNPRRRRVGGALCALVVAFIAIGYARDIHRDQQAWARAADESDRVLNAIVASAPNPSPGTTMYTFGHPGSESPGIVIFAFSWDLNGAIKLAYDDPTIVGYAILEGTTMRCQRDRVGPFGLGWTDLQSARYGKAIFVDVARARAERIDSPRECLRAISRFSPGPQLRIP